jgi:prepilin-type N-terminal cleavage/methylation domain-containing protein
MTIAPRHSTSRARAGFSLTEILIALAILVIGMLGILAAFASALDLHKRGIDQTTAALLAETILEGGQAFALEGKTPDEISTKQGGQCVFVESEHYAGYQYKIVCEPLENPAGEPIDGEYKMTVDVRLRPHAEGGETVTVRFHTILLAR